MKKASVLLGFFVALCSFFACEEELNDQYTETNDDLIEQFKKTNHKSKLQTREFASESLLGNLIGNTELRKLKVYTPPGYDHKRPEGYPVVYLLHGLPFSEMAYINLDYWAPWVFPYGHFPSFPDFPTEGFQAWIDNLIASGKMDPMIIVMPNAESVPYGFSFYSDSELNGNFEQYIVNDLLSFIDKRYNTIPSKEGRYIIGNSQGGYGAVVMGMKYPDKFSIIAAHSAPLVFEMFLAFNQALLLENPEGLQGPDPEKFVTSGYYAMAAAWSPNLANPPFFVDLPMEFPSGAVIEPIWSKWLQNDPFSLLDNYFANFSQLDGIFIDCGDSDEFGWYMAYPFFQLKMNAYGIDHFMEIFPGGHFDKMFERLEKSLIYCSENNSF